jgi:hypothetical protein
MDSAIVLRAESKNRINDVQGKTDVNPPNEGPVIPSNKCKNIGIKLLHDSSVAFPQHVVEGQSFVTCGNLPDPWKWVESV